MNLFALKSKERAWNNLYNYFMLVPKLMSFYIERGINAYTVTIFLLSHCIQSPISRFENERGTEHNNTP